MGMIILPLLPLAIPLAPFILIKDYIIEPLIDFFSNIFM